MSCSTSEEEVRTQRAITGQNNQQTSRGAKRSAQQVSTGAMASSRRRLELSFRSSIPVDATERNDETEATCCSCSFGKTRQKSEAGELLGAAQLMYTLSKSVWPWACCCGLSGRDTVRASDCVCTPSSSGRSQRHTDTSKSSVELRHRVTLSLFSQSCTWQRAA